MCVCVISDTSEATKASLDTKKSGKDYDNEDDEDEDSEEVMQSFAFEKNNWNIL